MAAFGLAGTLGGNDLAQIADGLAQPGWVQRAGRLEQDRFGLGSELIGQVADAVGQNPSLSRRDLASVRAGAVAVRGRRPGPGRSGPGPGLPRRPAAAADQPGRGRSWLLAAVGPGRPLGIHPGEFFAPLAVQAVGQLPRARTRSTRTTSGRPSRSRAARSSRSAASTARSSGWPTGGRAGELTDPPPTPGSNVCSSPWGQPVNPTPTTTTIPKNVDNVP